MLSGMLLSWCPLRPNLRQAAELVPVEAHPLQRRELAKSLRQAADELVSVEANFCNAVSRPMRSGELLSWGPVRPNFCNAVRWPIVSGQLLMSWFPSRPNLRTAVSCYMLSGKLPSWYPSRPAFATP